MTSAFFWQNSISLCPASFRIPRPNLPVTPGVSWLPTFAFQIAYHLSSWFFKLNTLGVFFIRSYLLPYRFSSCLLYCGVDNTIYYFLSLLLDIYIIFNYYKCILNVYIHVFLCFFVQICEYYSWVNATKWNSLIWYFDT